MRYTALRKLFHLNRATTLRGLALLPGNRLEALEENPDQRSVPHLLRLE
jgi:plasmid maintenance system killer protein